tara:strand:+ start:8206 stop:9177 length:972 start_codon:yes stop_codon:yes gene_type:complete
LKEIKINFSDFWPDFDNHNNRFLSILKKNYKVIFSEKPDYLIYSCYGNKHLNYDCIKIFYTGENIVPDFNLCDYAIGFHYLNFEDRYLRMPFAKIEPSYSKLLTKNIDEKKVLNRKFCNFVYSNSYNSHPMRKDFFKAISNEKKIDSGGSLYNNLGYQVDNKLAFISNYKFTIAIENSKINGYVTEKLIEPMSVNSIPIYWGNPSIAEEFNIDSFVHIKSDSKNDIRNAVDEVIFLSENDNAYLEKINKPWLNNEQYEEYDQIISNFFDNIITKPLNEAFKTAKYGFNKSYYKNKLRLIEKSEFIDKIKFKDKLKLFIKTPFK